MFFKPKSAPFDVCIIGGMGPAATAELMRRTVLYTEAKADAHHASVCVFNAPHTPDRSEYILSGEIFPKGKSFLRIRENKTYVVHCVWMNVVSYLICVTVRCCCWSSEKITSNWLYIFLGNKNEMTTFRKTEFVKTGTFLTRNRNV